MHILILRSWTPLSYGATYADRVRLGVGGTEQQMLNHASHLVSLGHVVTIIGVSTTTVEEQGVRFLAFKSEAEALQGILALAPDVVLFNVSSGLAALRAALPQAVFAEVCQNGPHFAQDAETDYYIFVGSGQLAHYSVEYPRFRRKFVLIESVPPWEQIYAGIDRSRLAEKNQIIWVGSLDKQGVRRWAKALDVVLRNHPELHWKLCVPSYDSKVGRESRAFANLKLPWERVCFTNLPASNLASEIACSQILLASLGGEDGPVSYLDGHAAGVPVLCGDDIYGMYFNPGGLGLRCTSTSECVDAVEFLLARPKLRRRMGQLGRTWIENNFTAAHQRKAMEQFIGMIELHREYASPRKTSTQSDRKRSARFFLERAEIKVASKWARLKSGYERK